MKCGNRGVEIGGQNKTKAIQITQKLGKIREENILNEQRMLCRKAECTGETRQYLLSLFQQ